MTSETTAAATTTTDWDIDIPYGKHQARESKK